MIVLIVEKCAMTWMVFVIFSNSMVSICEGSPQIGFLQKLGILSILSHFSSTNTSRKGVKEFYFSLLTLFSSRKRVKSGAKYNRIMYHKSSPLIYLPDCIFIRPGPDHCLPLSIKFLKLKFGRDS